MATYIGSGDTLAQKIYHAGLTHQAEVQSIWMSFCGKSEDAVFKLIEDTNKERGDTVQMRFSPTEDSDGVSEGDQIIGNGQSVSVLTDEMKIGWLGESWELDSPMSQIRVSFSLKELTYLKALVWWSRRYDVAHANQMCGFLPANDQGKAGKFMYSGQNQVVAYDANHTIRPNDRATDQALIAGDTLTLGLIDEIVTQASSTAYLQYPIAPDPSGFYHLVIHPVQLQQLRENTLSGEWRDLQRAKLEGGENWTGNPLYNNIAGVYNQTCIHVSDRCTKGVHSSTEAEVANTRRAVFMGAHAAFCAFGEEYGDGDHLDWHEEVVDHKRWSLLVDSVFGVKRTIYDGETYGAIVVPTYAAA